MAGKKKPLGLALKPSDEQRRALAMVPNVGQGDPLYAVGDELSDGETTLVDNAVDHLNTVVNRSGIDLAVEVSSYVIERFFDGDYQAFLNPSRYKVRSFTALCQHPELTFPQATLYALVRIGHQLDELPPSVARALSTRHHRALLTLDDPAEKVAFAQQAIAERWTAATLEANVRAARGPTKAGRRPLPSVVKSFRAIRRNLNGNGEPLSTISPEQRQELESIFAEVEAHILHVRAELGSLPVSSND